VVDFGPMNFETKEISMNALDVLAYAIIGVVALAGAALLVIVAIEGHDTFLMATGTLVLLFVTGWAFCRVSE